MMDRVTLRARSDADAAALRALREEHIMLQFQGLPDELRDNLVTSQRLAFQRGVEAYAPVQNWVIELDGEPAGELVIADRDHEQHIVDVLVAPRLQGRGIGGSALRIALGHAESRGVPSRLLVERSNPATKLYKRLGFAVTASDDLHFTMHRPTHPTVDHV